MLDHLLMPSFFYPSNFSPLFLFLELEQSLAVLLEIGLKDIVFCLLFLQLRILFILISCHILNIFKMSSSSQNTIFPVDLLPERPLTLIEYIFERIQPFRISERVTIFKYSFSAKFVLDCRCVQPHAGPCPMFLCRSGLPCHDSMVQRSNRRCIECVHRGSSSFRGRRFSGLHFLMQDGSK